jgi:hypothetical protein
MYEYNGKLYQIINFIYDGYSYCVQYELTERSHKTSIEICFTEEQINTLINDLIKLRDINKKENEEELR